MKNSKIIKYLEKAINQKAAQKKRALKHVLKRMKKKQHRLKAKLAMSTTETERAVIKAKLKVNRAHRKKGVQALRDIAHH